jgi:hypothetical protein
MEQEPNHGGKKLNPVFLQIIVCIVYRFKKENELKYAGLNRRKQQKGPLLQRPSLMNGVVAEETYYIYSNSITCPSYASCTEPYSFFKTTFISSCGRNESQLVPTIYVCFGWILSRSAMA